MEGTDEFAMTNVVSTNITSPIGLTTEENYLNVKQGRTAISTIHDWNGIPGQISVGIFADELRSSLLLEGFTWYESLIVHSIKEAASHTEIDFSSERLGLIIATTKGNVECLDDTYSTGVNYSSPGVSARKIASHLGIVTEPVVVCNACVSGVTAQVLACRYIASAVFDTVIVCGADTVNRFCLAGFSSFKALSPYPCRPFDIERLGLNIGECASTVILSKNPAPASSDGCWQIISSHLDNDAYHISAPAPSGDGVKRAIDNALSGKHKSELGCICAHGTATMFNDQMESKAIESAGLSDVPVSAFKGIYGHTFGAAGVIEPVLAMRALTDGVVLPICGFEETGVSGKINICSQETGAVSKSFLKIISGFGGCNGAVLYSLGKQEFTQVDTIRETEIEGSVKISTNHAELDGKDCCVTGSNSVLLTQLYKRYLDDNARFYKMDTFSRLAYVATGMLISGRCASFAPEDISMMFFNKSSSLVADRQHIRSFAQTDSFYPSPAVFINTLPNVVMGEIAIKYNIKGETTFVILAERNDKIINTTVQNAFACHPDSLMVAGWVECDSEDNFEADLQLIHIK